VSTTASVTGSSSPEDTGDVTRAGARPSITVRRADPHDASDIATVVALLDAYARDPFGGAHPLSDAAREALGPALRDRPGMHALLAFDSATPVGLAICIEGFSTFAGKPLLNIHDLAVQADARGRGVGRALMDAVVALATTLGCCKVTLEVLEGNATAQALYARAGFAPYALYAQHGRATFWQRWIDAGASVSAIAAEETSKS
jgi:ribosomal protein S18 acetylase RimI-like enzyme